LFRQGKLSRFYSDPVNQNRDARHNLAARIRVGPPLRQARTLGAPPGLPGAESPPETSGCNGGSRGAVTDGCRVDPLALSPVPRRKPSRGSRARRRAPDDRAARLLPRRRPLQERARQRVERILEATVELLAGCDLEALSTAQIAQRAGVPIGSVYHYFPSKEAILAELAGRKFEAVDAAFTERLGRDLGRMDWRRALERSVDASVTAFRSDPAYVAVWRTTRSSPAFRSVAQASDERFARALEALPILEPLRPARARLVLRTAIRIANAFLDWILETKDPRQVASIVREMKRALVAYLGSELEA
jgi:AcrR family transcriptional regulator